MLDLLFWIKILITLSMYLIVLNPYYGSCNIRELFTTKGRGQ